ncbi:integrin beta-3-like [Dysidea avara]|uniref:integrin beta-3-like n=1 Tax=Dysidea avara TaxID=196820 RepID=UPI00331CED1C
MLRVDMLVIALCLGVLMLQGVSGQSCNDHTTCDECLRSSPQCIWCDNLEYRNDSCFERDNNASRLMCGAENVVDVVGNLSITKVNKTPDTIVDLERVSIHARPREVYSFMVNIHVPLNYPLDFYYLMDFSCSMDNDLETIQGLSTDIIGTLKNLTTDFQIGFGAFSDKEALPFTFERKEFPYCAGNSTPNLSLLPQHVPFDYIHYLSLTDNETLFIDNIAQLNITSNQDTPESTLDALVQAAVCNELIGWRPAASHIVLVASDAGYHIAGDGKMVGALKPNDGKCHMSPSDEGEGIYQFDQNLQLDYPSIGQAEAVLRDRNIVPIFAITKQDKSIDHYMRNFKGAACEKQCHCPIDENGMECGGVDRGNCTCDDNCNGVCICDNMRYTGKACNCSLNTTACMTGSSLCSGNGLCECNKCICAPSCLGDDCYRCRDQLQCPTHRACVQCELSSANYSNSIRRRINHPENCENRCRSETVSIAPVNSTFVSRYTIEGYETIHCRFADRDSCSYMYYVALDNDYYLLPIDIENTLRCERCSSNSTSNLMWIIPIAIVIGLLVIGLTILLIIKLCLIMLDYVEVRKFEKLVKDAEGKLVQTSQPLYQFPVVEYQNPVYGKSKKEEK